MGVNSAITGEIDERMNGWSADEGPFDRVYYSCPVRTWPELMRATPAPPFAARDARVVRIPLDVRVPTFRELRRVRAAITRGSNPTRP